MFSFIDFEATLFDTLYDALNSSENLIPFISPTIQGKYAFMIKGTHVGFVRRLSVTESGFSTILSCSEPSLANHATAIIEIKLGKQNCGLFNTNESRVTSPPSLRGPHKALGQGLIHAFDVWHCLAKQGRPVSKIPVVVLGARKLGCSADMSQKLQCINASLCIPDKCKKTFTDDDYLCYTSSSRSLTGFHFQALVLMHLGGTFDLFLLFYSLRTVL
jgi:hypothetical protein